MTTLFRQTGPRFIPEGHEQLLTARATLATLVDWLHVAEERWVPSVRDKARNQGRPSAAEVEEAVEVLLGAFPQRTALLD